MGCHGRWYLVIVHRIQKSIYYQTIIYIHVESTKEEEFNHNNTIWMGGGERSTLSILFKCRYNNNVVKLSMNSL